MNNYPILAIDPGLNGGIATIIKDFAEAISMPDSEGDIMNKIRSFREETLQLGCTPIAVIEKVPFGGIPNASALAKLHSNAGFCRGICQTLGFRLEMIPPKDWQEYFHLGKANDCANKTAWKNKLKSEAQRIYPALSKTITLNTSDALLILEWADAKFNRGKVVI